MPLIDTLLPNWTNPEAVAAVVGLRVLCNALILWVISNIAGVRSSSTAIVGGLFGFSTITTLLLLFTNWLSHPISHIEQLSQLIILVVSLFILVRNEFNILTVISLLACSGAAFLMVPMTIIYAEIFVAP